MTVSHSSAIISDSDFIQWTHRNIVRKKNVKYVAQVNSLQLTGKKNRCEYCSEYVCGRCRVQPENQNQIWPGFDDLFCQS